MNDKIISVIKNCLSSLDEKFFLEILQNSLKNGLDYINEQKKDKIIYSDYKHNDRDIELDIFLNSQNWRIISLIESSTEVYERKRILSSLINLRHVYETIVHNFYLLKNLEIHLISEEKEILSLDGEMPALDMKRGRIPYVSRAT